MLFTWHCCKNFTPLVHLFQSPNSATCFSRFLFQTMNIPDSEVNDAEQKLTDHLREILIQAMNEFNSVEIVEENTIL